MEIRKSIPLALAAAMLSFGSAWADDQDNTAPAASDPMAQMPDPTAAPVEGGPAMDSNVLTPPGDVPAPGASDDNGPAQPQEGAQPN
jgi:hypothetical protein